MRRSMTLVIAAQAVALASAAALGFLVPHFLTVEGFGYWQIYVLYSSFVGFLSMGFIDGVYLRFGGYEYAALPFRELRGPIRLFSLMLFTLSAVVVVVSLVVADPATLSLSAFTAFA